MAHGLGRSFEAWLASLLPSYPLGGASRRGDPRMLLEDADSGIA
jgi:hypothetical protein